MSGIIILHDLSKEESAACLPAESDSVTLFPAPPGIQSCVGCFGCWTKTPGMCVIKDGSNALAPQIPDHDVLCVVSRCTYGGLSPEVKVVLERSIAVISPFFGVVKGEMHHLPRYRRMPAIAYHFYGAEISEQEKATAQKLTEANATNLFAPRHETYFHASIAEIKEALS